MRPCRRLAALVIALAASACAADPYDSPAAVATDAWATQVASPAGRFLAWAKASGRRVPAQVWILPPEAASALKDLAALRSYHGALTAAVEATHCQRTFAALPDFERLCRARLSELRWRRIAAHVPEATAEAIGWTPSPEAAWVEGAARAAASESGVHVSLRSAWIVSPAPARRTAGCADDACAGVLAASEVLARHWLRDIEADTPGRVANTRWPPNFDTRLRVRILKQALSAAAYLGIAPGKLLEQLAPPDASAAVRRRLDRAARRLEAALVELGQPLSAQAENRLAMETGIEVLADEALSAPDEAEDATLLETLRALSTLPRADLALPEARFFSWLAQSGRHAPATAYLPAPALLAAVTRDRPDCAGLSAFDASGRLTRACDLHEHLQYLHAEKDWEALDEWHHRRAPEWFGKLRELGQSGPFAHAEGVFLDGDALRKSYRWPMGGNAMARNWTAFASRLRQGVGEISGRLLIAAHEAAHDLLRDERWTRFMHTDETPSNPGRQESETGTAEGDAAFSEIFADAWAVLTVGAYLGQSPADLADRLAFARRPVLAAAARRHDPHHLTAPALERLARILRRYGAPQTPEAEVSLALAVAAEAPAVSAQHRAVRRTTGTSPPHRCSLLRHPGHQRSQKPTIERANADRSIAAIGGELPQRQLWPMSGRSGDRVERRVPDQLPVVRVTRFFCSAMPDWPGPVY